MTNVLRHWISARTPATWSRVVTAGVASRRRVGSVVPRHRQHRRARDVARGRGRRAVDVGPPTGSWPQRNRAGTSCGSQRACRVATCCLRSTTTRFKRAGDVVDVLHAAGDDRDASLYRPSSRHARGPRPAVARRCRTVPGALYFVLAAVGMFTLLVGGAVRLRRPRDPATLHFFWLAVAFFGVFTFSFSGRLDRLDWVFYWADVICDAGAAAAVPALHAGVPRAAATMAGRRPLARAASLLAIYVPAVVLGDRAHRARSPRSSGSTTEHSSDVDCAARSPRVPRTSRSCLIGGLLGAAPRAARVRIDHRAASAALDRLGHGARRRCRSRSATRCRMPLGVEPSLPMELSAIPLSLIPLAFASAIVRYRLMDVEVIVKRALVYIAAFAADRGDLRGAARGRAHRTFVQAATIGPVGDRAAGDAGRGAAGAAGQGLRAERCSTARSTAIATTTAARWSALRAT